MDRNSASNKKSKEYNAPDIGDQNSGQYKSQAAMPSINLPKGGGAIKSIEEKFKVNAASGTFSFTIPVPLSPSRKGVTPALSLNYNSGAGNGPFGLGWDMAVPSISRKTEKKLPQYKDEEESDTFILSGAEDLIPLLEQQGSHWVKYVKPKTENGTAYTVKRYRPRIESLFLIIEKWEDDANGKTFWKTITKDNIHSFYGLNDESRISDPNDSTKIFSWLLCKTLDDKGSISLYKYKKEDFKNIPQSLSEKNRINNCTQVYLKEVLYGNKTAFYKGDATPADTDFLFRVILDYGEHDASEQIPKDIHQEKFQWTKRKDSFSTYRAGFEIRTYRRCSRILVFHCFDQPDLPHSPYLVKSLQLFYDQDLQLLDIGKNLESFSFLNKARLNGHKWNSSSNTYSTKFLPEIEIGYQQHQWERSIQYVTKENLVHAPIGIDNRQYLWIDLFSEGIAGILTEQSGAWYYKSNLGKGDFTHAMPVAAQPSIDGLSVQSASIMDLAGNGVKYLVQMGKEPKGYFKLTEEEEWEPFKYFNSLPSQNLLDPNTRAIDLTGDGTPDLLITEENKLRWYKGIGEQGFELSDSVAKEIDEEKGPAIVFADLNQSVFLADMDGDGLTDIVRIRNGEICYWPNLGYGKFGAKVTMENAPLFDLPDLFNPSYLRLADIDGSGTTDIIYLGKNDFRVWMNKTGNEWTAAPEIIDAFPNINNMTDVSVMDFLGSGTSCIVYSSPIKDQPLQYIDLMASKKPNLMAGYQNNCGKFISVEYKSSTHFYLEDKKAGRKWITKLPFPVHCVSKIQSEDKIRQSLFVNSYRYSHGYFDATEKEFRGFARVEQFDTENFETFKINTAKNVVEEDLHQPPVRTVSWFHTGAYLLNKKVLHQCEREYFDNELLSEYELPEPVIPEGLSAEEVREAFRSCKSLPLRTEVYAEDGSDKSSLPYTASGTAYEIRLMQPKGENPFASFLVSMSESIAYTYERDPKHPRIAHSYILETDEIGNVLKSATVVYPRLERPVSPNEIPDKVWEEQNKLHIVYEEKLYTNDIINDTVYRLRTGYETRSYEVSGINEPLDFFIRKNDLLTDVTAAGELLFEEEFTTGVQKRLSNHTRSYFLKDDLSGSLPLGQLSNLGITYKNYQLAFTKNLVTKYYGTKVTDQMLTDAKYEHSEGDAHWWVPSGEMIFPADAKSKFYIYIGARDVFGNESFVEFDKYNLLMVSTTNAIHSKTTSVNDYRLLSSGMVIDPNLNRSAVENDELGFVIKSAIMGKEGDGLGDTLADPTARMEYDLFNWQHNGKPNYVHSFMREKHGANNPRWQESYMYSDGGGSIIMMKNQAEPGKASRWNTVTKTVEEVDANPRWVGNGRVILNNKGKPVKIYQPYFSTTHEYESEDALVETGFTSTIYYDPLGKNTLTLFPNGTFAKVEFDAWYQKSYDVNDTVKDSQWYIDRGSPDPLLIPEPSDPEERAAWLAAKNYDTPNVRHSDSRGKSFYTIADYGNGRTTSIYSESDLFGRYAKVFDQLGRNVSEGNINMLGATIYRKSAEKGERWIFADVMGRLVKLWDNNIHEFRSSFDKLHRPVSSYMKDGPNEVVVSYMVYGDLLTNAEQQNLKGRLYQLYDQSGVLTNKVIDFKGNQLETERKLTKKYDEVINWQALDGLTTISAIETTAATLLETEVFTSSSEVDALNRPVTVTFPDHSIMEPNYNEANYLDSLKVKVRGQGNFITFLENQDYDALGLRQFAKYGNGLLTNYIYDPKNFRLLNLLTKADGASDAQSKQNLFYTYDPVGNIVFSKDDAQQTHYFKNAVVKPESKFEYDAIYQLLMATGREHAGLGGNVQRNQNDLPFIDQLPHDNDSNAVRNYTERYQYDDCGNILQLQHIASGANWNQHYRYQYQDNLLDNTNRVKATSLPGDPASGPYTATYNHDLHGNITSMPHLNQMVWNFMDQLKEVDLGGGGKAYYVYGVNGSRTRKIIERPGGKRLERIYLGSVEIYREYQGTVKKLERNTLHVSDNTGRIAQVDTKLLDIDNSDTANPLNENLIRYRYTNHLGSATMETDETGAVISYEEYHPYGTSAYRSSKSGVDLSLKRYRFSGKERDDETGFYYFGARYYASWLGRWTSSDPAGYVSGLNLYKYCSNNPVMLHDPNGMDDYPTIWTYNPRNYTKEEQAIVGNPNADPSRVLEIFTAHGYHGGGPLEWKSDYGRHGGWVRTASGETEALGTGSGGGTGASSSSSSGGTGGTTGGGTTGSTTGSATGSSTGSDTGSATGSASGSATGSSTGSDTGSAGGSASGSAGGSATGSAGGSATGTGTGGTGGGSATGSAGGTQGGTGSGGGGGGRNYITNSFWRGLLTGFAIALTIVLLVALAPITIPASIAIGAAVVGVGLTAYSITQSIRQRDLLNRPISEEQANYNLGMGIGGIFGGAAGGALAGPTAAAGGEFAQGMRSLAPAFAGVGPSGGTIAVTGIAGTSIATGTGVAATGNVLMMESGEGGGEGGGSGGSPSSREFFDLDEAAEAVLGEGAEMGARIGPLKPINNPGVENDLRALGYDPGEFTPVQYWAHGAQGGNYIITVFESEGGVYFGPHLSSANW